jgi:hypothetical protein
MKDNYLQADSFDALAGMLTEIRNGVFQVKYDNIIGPFPDTTQATDSTTLSVDKRLSNIQQAQVDTPVTYYACVRTDEDLTLPDTVTVADDATAQAVIGVWA